MSRKTRVAIAVVATIAAFGGMIAYSALRVRHWDGIGMAGMTYWPPTEKTPSPIRTIKPGAIFLLYPGGSAERAGLRPNDMLVSIGGVPITDEKGIQALERRVRTGDEVVYRIRRGNRMLDVPVTFRSPLSNSWYLTICVVALFVAITFVKIGIFVFVKNPGDRRVLVFYAMVIVGALSFVGAPALTLDSSNIRGIHRDNAEAAILPLAVLFASILAFLPLSLHLALIFPRERAIFRTSPHVLRWVYGIPIATAIGIVFLVIQGIAETISEDAERALALPLNVVSALLTLAGFAIALRVVRAGRAEGVRKAFWNRPVQSIFFITAILLAAVRVGDLVETRALKIAIGLAVSLGPCLLLFVGFPIFTCVALYRSYREAGVEERRQVKWPLWGTIIALATRITLVVVIQSISTYLMLSGGEFSRFIRVAQIVDTLSMLLYLLIPLSFAFAILKYRLMNIDIIIRKTVVYAFLTGAIIVMYLVLVGGLGTLLVNVAGVKDQTMVIASTLVVALLIIPLRNKLQLIVDRTLFRHKYQYPDALKAISAETLTAHDLGAFLSSAAEKVQQALQNRSVVVFVPRHEELVAAAKIGVADSVIGTLRMARTPFMPMLDRPFDPTRHALPEDAAAAMKRIEATLVVPINTPGTPPNGFLALAPKLSNAQFDVEDIDFLRSVADQLDVGIDRIRQQREEADFEQARAIQQSLLPHEMPHVEGVELSGVWQSARMMAGDYYDVLKLSDTELAICIGDVAGKGMPAALLMSGLQAAVRASASSSPRDLCERVRRVVVSSLSGGRFVTFFYATIDTAAMRLRWCNAGHNAPILVRADGSIVRLSEGGPAFSRLFRDDRYQEQEIAIGAGDRIVLFTDGVSEAAGGDGEIFGEQRLEQLVISKRDRSARELQQAIVDAATAFSGGELEDDLTIVAAAVA